ncbi:membrane dipeptidase [Streptomyces flaveolus]|uniref:membrane dipeptidase n=1 Tax=Streptomyces flaveolus TaxID=67297 RepID=UPI003F5404B1
MTGVRPNAPLARKVASAPCDRVGTPATATAVAHDRRSPRRRTERPSGELLERAHSLLAGHPVADGHGGLPWVPREVGEAALDTDVSRLCEGHLGALFWSLHPPEAAPGGGRALTATLERLDLVRTVVETHPEGLRLVRTAGEIIDARNCGRVAVVPGPAHGAALDGSLAVLRMLRALGPWVLTLAGTAWAGGPGLTRFGEEAVREMNRLGVLADVSGASPATVARAVALSRTPVLCTRSAARALRPHPANLLAALGEAKGLCMVPLTAEQTGPAVTDVADHLDHVRDVAGPESVGLSGTHDPGAAHPRDLAGASRCPHLIAELLRRGWSETELALLTWGNAQRVLRGADSTARAAQYRTKPAHAKFTEPDPPGASRR